MHVTLAFISASVGAQSDAISTAVAKGRHRVHCSLNINTETGRLSARRPNLQNQPALEKDRYKVCSNCSWRPFLQVVGVL